MYLIDIFGIKINAMTTITVEAIINASIEKVWESWTQPQHITKWNAASDDWHTPYAENDLQEGGKMLATMAAKDGSFSFDFWGTHTKVLPLQEIATTLGDDRKMSVTFTPTNDGIKVLETFEPESQNSLELQQQGWQAILNNFKKYTESL
jgi:uncharacterized protein YndB with AHSA1/START domain